MLLTLLKSKFSCVIGTAESKLGGIVDTLESEPGSDGLISLSQNSMVSLTVESDLGGILDTAKSDKPQST
jgi:hypothetical protein